MVFMWDGGKLIEKASISVDVSSLYRLLAVVPAAMPQRPGIDATARTPGTGTSSSYLMIGDHEQEKVTVLSLPKHEVICVWSCPGVTYLSGLAADPSGRAIAICNYSDGTHVVPWPPEGVELPL
jgi:hypothetical protein